MTDAPADLSDEVIGYLTALVRQDIKKHQKSIDAFTTRPEQNEVEATEILRKFLSQQSFRVNVYQMLTKTRITAHSAGAAARHASGAAPLPPPPAR
jgi:hypothetical protein